MDKVELTPIAYIRTGFADKFGIPRQSGRIPELCGRIEFVNGMGTTESLKGLEGYTHIWVIWGFSGNAGKYNLTVRPPRLGGNERVGVWASRSPFRPNPLGLSSLKIESIDNNVIEVSGIDMMDMTPIYDIKPYIPYTDIHMNAGSGYAGEQQDYHVLVDISGISAENIPKQILSDIIKILEEDPRPAYHNDDREYKMDYAGFNVVFCYENNAIRVKKIKQSQNKNTVR